MATNEPMWKTLLQAAQDLQGPDDKAFSWAQIMTRAQELDPSHNRIAFGSTFQSMVIQSPSVSTSPVGKVFDRVSHGQYLVAGPVYGDEYSTPKLLSESVTRALTLMPNQVESHRRARQLAARFDAYVTHYGSNVPYFRIGLLENHRKAIALRREFSSVGAAVSDAEFLESLYQTLQAWGRGRRGFALVSRREFAEMLRFHLEKLAGLAGLSIEDPDLDAQLIGAEIANLINVLGVVSNVSKIVAGSATLHYLLPDLVPPLDREWSGRFFMWKPQDLQNQSEVVFADAFVNLARVAVDVRPSRLLNGGWNTSSSMILDNALIGYCQIELVDDDVDQELDRDQERESIPSFLDLVVETGENVPPRVEPRRHWYSFWRS